jgi:excisionase family DNA binding protein
VQQAAAAPAGAPPDPRLYTINDLCERTGRSYYLIRSQIAQGRLRSLLVGRRRLITEEQFQEWLALLHEEARTEPLPHVQHRRSAR